MTSVTNIYKLNITLVKLLKWKLTESMCTAEMNHKATLGCRCCMVSQIQGPLFVLFIPVPVALGSITDYYMITFCIVSK